MGDLLSQEGRDVLFAQFSELPKHKRPEVGGAFDLYRAGFREADRGLWEDPEAYMVALEAALANPAKMRRLSPALTAALNSRPYFLRQVADEKQHPAVVRGLLGAAKWVVAAQAYGFLGDVTVEDVRTDERWGPYRHWFDQLTPDDVVATFNYDRGLELLHAARDPQLVAGIRVVHSPGGPAPRTAVALKLHGSVSWELAPDGEQGWQFVEKADDHCLHCEEPAIATPGRGKVATARYFDGLWQMAESAIKKASQVYFVGYRFPPSDAEARGRILGALRGANELATVAVVLGDSVADRERLTALVSMTAPNAQVEASPLRAEEFLSVWTPSYVGPPRANYHSSPSRSPG
jgi:hypothetical protein